MFRQSAYLSLALGMLALLSPAQSRASHSKDGCSLVVGRFTAVRPATCASPVGICTFGTLTGTFPSTYAFTVDSLIPANDPNAPNLSYYIGHSVLTPADGTAVMFGHDFGQMYVQPDGTADFVTTISVEGGTQRLKKASGKLIAPGILNLSTGSTTGFYTGKICR